MNRRPFLTWSAMHCAALLSAGAWAAPLVLFQTVTTTADSGAGSLRQAIISANGDQPNATQIDFAIPGDGPHTIQPLTPLPEIFATVFILGDTQPGFVDTPLIELSGLSAGVDAKGLVIRSSGSIVRGLAITDWDSHGISIGSVQQVGVEQCHIGVGPTGTEARPNGCGVVLVGAANCRIGTPGAGNLISGNQMVTGTLQTGIHISGGGGNSIVGNRIGTDVTGTSALGNRWGIFIFSSADNVIGGATSPERNIISGNIQGIRLTGVATISAEIHGNFIGTDITGTAAVPNSTGLFIESPMVFIGGSGPGEGNLISGNTVVGARLPSSEDSVFRGNLIGLAADGVTALPNGIGIELADAIDCVIGGATSPERNIISGNLGDGIHMTGGFDNQVLNNFIGTDATGLIAVPNDQSGVNIDSSGVNGIGGRDSGQGNVISGNRGVGVSIHGSGSSCNVVRGNVIGLDATGTAPLGNLQGIQLSDEAQMNVIGGNLPNDRNVISGNGDDGIMVLGGALETEIYGNLIGTDASGGGSIGNGGNGVSLLSGGNYIGNLGDGGGNLIAHSGGSGVEIQGFDNLVVGNTIFENALGGVDVVFGQGNTVSLNSISRNGGLGIDLGQDGVTVNPTVARNTQVNDGQRYPEITRAVLTDTSFAVDVRIVDTPNTDFEIEIFSNAVCDPSGFGEGQQFVFGLTVTTNAFGGGVGLIETTPAGLEVDRFITATATGPDGSTSEFSPCVVAEGVLPTIGEIVAFLLGLIPDPGDLDLTMDGTVDAADVVTRVGVPPGETP